MLILRNTVTLVINTITSEGEKTGRLNLGVGALYNISAEFEFLGGEGHLYNAVLWDEPTTI